MTDPQPPSYMPSNARSRPGSARVKPAGNTGGTPPSYAPRSQASASRSSASRAYSAGSSTDSHSSYGRAPRQPRPRSTTSRTAPSRNRASAPRGSAISLHRLRPKKIITWILVFIIVIPLAWLTYLFLYGNSQLEHVEALSGRANTPGDTYLIVGSDRREKDVIDDGVEGGERSDTIMLLQLPDTGHAALISLPRDTLVDIPGYGAAKINAAYSYGGAPLLVQTVEELTGLTVDHYVEVSMGSVLNLVNAVGGVNLCYDADVSDAFSGMEWTAGCHDVDGNQALAFSRMRYSDPYGDIGRTNRQRQVVSKVVDKAVSTDTIVRPWRQRAIVGAAAQNLSTDTDTSLFALAQAGLGLRSVMGEGGLMGTPPIASMDYWYDGQSCVLLDPDIIDVFWDKLARGELTREDFNQIDG